MTSTHHDPNIMAVPGDFCLGIPFTDLQSNDQKESKKRGIARHTLSFRGRLARWYCSVVEWVCITAQVDSYILGRSSIPILSRNTTLPVICPIYHLGRRSRYLSNSGNFQKCLTVPQAMNNPAYRASRSGRRNRILEKLLSDILVPDSYDGVGEVKSKS